jgi:hypothetical protein
MRDGLVEPSELTLFVLERIEGTHSTAASILRIGETEVSRRDAVIWLASLPKPVSCWGRRHEASLDLECDSLSGFDEVQMHAADVIADEKGQGLFGEVFEELAGKPGALVEIVCGGSSVVLSVDGLRQWRREYVIPGIIRTTSTKVPVGERDTVAYRIRVSATPVITGIRFPPET